MKASKELKKWLKKLNKKKNAAAQKHAQRQKDNRFCGEFWEYY